MAGRPPKEGLDYFELDCHMDEKVSLIEAEFGLKGFAIVVKLLQHIYGGHGYYCEWTPDLSLLWAAQNVTSQGGDSGQLGKVYPKGDALSGYPTNIVNNVVSASIRRDIFSKELFEKYRILTSSGIQKRYFRAVSRREFQNLKKEYLLISVGKNPINVSNNSISADNNSINVSRNATEKRIQNNIYIFSLPALNELFDQYVKSRPQPFTGKVIEKAKDNLMKVAGGDEEKAFEILKQSIDKGWSGFYPLKGDKKGIKVKNTKFSNFDSRTSDYDALADELIRKQEDDG